MMHVIRFSGNERLSERLSWRLFGHLRRKRIGASKAVCEVHKRGFVTLALCHVAPASLAFGSFCPHPTYVSSCFSYCFHLLTLVLIPIPHAV